MGEWWGALNVEEQIYYGLAFLATGLLALQMLLMLVGSGADELVDAGDVDMDGPGEHPSGIHVLSMRTLVAFFVGFGWAGVVATREGLGEPTTNAMAALVMGLLFASVVFQVMRLLYRMQHSGSLDYHNALGEVGTVYLPIPGAMTGSGKIQVLVQGRLKVVQALTRHAGRIENRTRVRVVELVDESTLLVEPLAKGEGAEEE